MSLARLMLLLILAAGALPAACRQQPDPTPTPVPVPATLPASPLPDGAPDTPTAELPPRQASASPVLLPPFDRLESGWNVLLPGGDTGCALGDPFGFYVRPGDRARLLVYLQDGGACWNELLCRPGETATYDPNVSSADNPARSPTGIFQLDHPANPFRDHSMVFVPNCTADALVGTRTLTYEGAAGAPVTIRHSGAENVAAVFDWLAENFPQPETVFVAGSGTGGIASPLFAVELAHALPSAHVVQLADSAGGFRSDDGELETILLGWGAGEWLAGLLATQESGESAVGPTAFYLAGHTRNPAVRFNQVNSVADHMQVFFTRLAGASGRLLIERLDDNEAEVAAGIADFASYTTSGELNNLLTRPDFYTVQEGGTALWQWVAALAAGEPVESVRCAGC